MSTLILTILGIAGGVVATLFALRVFGRHAPDTTITATTIAERVKAVGKLVGLEVCAKEITTSTKGWGWLPPLILSQARVAMIFHFEKQYSVDLARLKRSDVEELGEGRFRITLPSIEGALRLTDVEPYDIQAGRVLGLLDIIQVNAPTQKELIRRAQEQAAGLYQANDERYRTEARSSIERQITTLLALFDVSVEIEWSADDPARDRVLVNGAGAT